MPPRKRLGQLLTELGVIDEHQLQSALGHQKQWGGKLGGIMVQKGFCKEDEVVSALSKHLSMPAVKLSQAKVDERAVKCVSKQIAEKLHVFPYELTGSGRGEAVTIAMSDPTDLSAVDQLAFHTGKRIKPMLAGDSEIISAIQQYYGGAEEKKEPTDKLAKPAAAPAPAAAAKPAATAPAASSQFPRRIDPQQAPTPVGATPRVAPYIPPPIPAAPARPAQKLEEIEPDESMKVPTPPPPRPEPLELPESEDDGSGQMMGLEPIAAHTQVEEVAGAEELAGEGSAADEVEGLVSAGVPHEGAGEAQQMEGLEPIAAHSQEPGWETQPVQSEGWETQPAAAAPAGMGWADTTVESAPLAESVGWADETPAPEAAVAESAPQGWSAGESAEGWGGDQPAAESPGELLPMDAIIGTAEPAEGAPAEQPGWGAEEPIALAVAATAAEEPAPVEEAAPVEHVAEAPDAWASSEDPLAAQSAANDATSWSDSPPPQAGWSEQQQETSVSAETAAESAAAAEAPAETEAPPEWGEMPAEEPPAQEEPAFEAPPAEESAAEAPPPEESAAEAASPEEPAFEAPSPEESAAEAASPEEPAFEAPSPEESAAEAPPPEEPAFEAPAPVEPAFEAAPPEELAAEAAPPEELAAEAPPPEEPAFEAPPPEEPAFEAPPPEEPAAEAPQPEPPAEFSEEQGGIKLEGWVAPPPEPEPQGAGWMGQALEAVAPLSPADLGALASLGVDPNDGVAALRLLAALVRVLNHRQLLDLDEVAAEVRESRAQGAAAAADADAQAPQNGEPAET
jgi:hypothetical protein